MLCMEKGGTQTKIFLTSSPIGIYRSEEPLDYRGFNPANGMVEALKDRTVDIVHGHMRPAERKGKG